MDYSIEKIEKALLEYFERNLQPLSDKKIKLIDIGVFPWHAKVEISFYVSGDSVAIDDIAAWSLYNYANMYEGGWDSGMEVAKDLEREWNKDNDILPFLFDFSSAVTSAEVRSVINKFNLESGFSIQILDPDSSDSENYCEW
ncbi:hypothetical protein [Zooshikella ganghwensis]|uniref:hypothetical protein n=1 Tax=Zooshikella ganghwensis TaxID=202772 RepID=UPI0003F742AA|nr:hypothetical protein [Zooshikella ganghwensis]